MPQAGIPFLFKQSSHIHTERGIDGLNRHIADLEGRDYSLEEPLLSGSIRRQRRRCCPSLSRRGKRFSDRQWTAYNTHADMDEQDMDTNELIRLEAQLRENSELNEG